MTFQNIAHDSYILHKTNSEINSSKLTFHPMTCMLIMDWLVHKLGTKILSLALLLLWFNTLNLHYKSFCCSNLHTGKTKRTPCWLLWGPKLELGTICIRVTNWAAVAALQSQFLGILMFIYILVFQFTKSLIKCDCLNILSWSYKLTTCSQTTRMLETFRYFRTGDVWGRIQRSIPGQWVQALSKKSCGS